MINTLKNMLVGGVSGLFGVAQNHANIAANKAEQEYVFRRNKELAALQNQYNIDMFNRTNQYNSPKEQMKRLREAGINPDLYYNTSGLTPATSPSMSAGTPMSPVDYSNKMSIGDVIQRGLDYELQKAQIENIKSQTNKTNKESDVIEINLQTLSTMNDADLRLKLKQIDFTQEQINNFVKQRDVMNAEIDNINSQINERYANVVHMSVQDFQRSLELTIQKNLTDATIKKIEAETDLTRKQIYRIAELLPEEVSNIQADTDLKKSQKSVNEANVNLINEDVNLRIAQKANVEANTDLLKSEKELTDKRVSISEIERQYKQDAFRVWQDISHIHKINIIENYLLF